ncbi:iron ABC transporter substrate-binding protein [Betaproteobacteria bacterium]|nr:iron ABC transporter substrate-binding protein [Betaproteobacteria bacterium]
MKTGLKLLSQIAAVIAFSAMAAPASAQTVVLYTSNNIETVDTALNVIRGKMPTLDVRQVNGGAGVLMKRIQAESGNPRGDILWSGGFGAIGAYKEYMAPYKGHDLDAIPKEFRSPDDLWVGTNIHLLLIMVNEKQLKMRGLPKPKTWSDLMKPEWKGNFAITDPGKSANAFLLIYGLLKQFGREGLEKIAANAIINASSRTTHEGTAIGEYAAGLTFEYAAQEYVAGGQKGIRLVYPTEGCYLSPEGIFLFKGAKNAEAAKILYNIFLSREMQQELLVKRFRRPARADIEVSKLTPLPDLKSVKIFPLDQTAASEEYEQLISLWELAVGKARYEQKNQGW